LWEKYFFSKKVLPYIYFRELKTTSLQSSNDRPTRNGSTNSFFSCVFWLGKFSPLFLTKVLIKNIFGLFYIENILSI
jgi:hypothetical protein